VIPALPSAADLNWFDPFMKTGLLHFGAVALIFCMTAIAALLAALTAPAQATYLAQLTVANNPVTAFCPLKVQFNGTVVGVANSPFQYWFTTLVNGVESVTPKTTMVMPMTGVASVTYSLPIANSSDQMTTNIVELDAADLAGQAKPTTSTQVKYFVTCRPSSGYRAAAAAMSLPSPSPSPNPLRATAKAAPTALPLFGVITVYPNAPKGMASTQDPQVCSQHMGWIVGLICQTGLSTGALALIWSTGNCDTCFDGYHLYRVDSGRRDLLQTQPDKSITGTIFAKEDGPFVGRCYMVTAYQGKLESADSSPACIGGGQVQVSESFSPTNQSSSHRYHVSSTGFAGAVSPAAGGPAGTNPSQLIVGFKYTTEKLPVGDSSSNVVNRMGLLFDLSKLSGKTVTKAVLHLHVDHAITGSSYFTDYHSSCATRIGAGIDRWWQYGDLSGEPGGVAASYSSGPDVEVDVTALVQGWTHNPNFGFVLYGAEDLTAFTENSCETWYTNGSSLDVAHY